LHWKQAEAAKEKEKERFLFHRVLKIPILKGENWGADHTNRSFS